MAKNIIQKVQTSIGAAALAVSGFMPANAQDYRTASGRRGNAIVLYVDKNSLEAGLKRDPEKVRNDLRNLAAMNSYDAPDADMAGLLRQAITVSGGQATSASVKKDMQRRGTLGQQHCTVNAPKLQYVKVVVVDPAVCEQQDLAGTTTALAPMEAQPAPAPAAPAAGAQTAKDCANTELAKSLKLADSLFGALKSKQGKDFVNNLRPNCPPDAPAAAKAEPKPAAPSADAAPVQPKTWAQRTGSGEVQVLNYDEFVAKLSELANAGPGAGGTGVKTQENVRN